MNISQAYDILFGAAIVILVLVMFVCLILAIRGPEIADRIVAVNMLGTLTIMVICILSLWLKQSYLLDVAIIYALISFLAVVVLTRVYLGVRREHMRQIELEEAAESAESEEVATDEAVSAGTDTQ